MKVYTLMHPLSAERAVLNGKLLVLRKTDEEEKGGNPGVGYRLTFVDAVLRKPLFVTTALTKPLVKEEDGSYSFETSSGIIYRLIDVRELLPTEEAPKIEAENLIVSQYDYKHIVKGNGGYLEHRFKFAQPVTREDFIRLCTGRGYKMKMEFQWHEDHTEIEPNTEYGTDWSYKWVRVNLD